MTLLSDVDVSGTKYAYSSRIPMGTSATPAGSEVKDCAFADSFELNVGNLISVTFTYANTYGDGSTTYPKLLINGTRYPVKQPVGGYAASGAWANGQAVTFMFDGTNLVLTTMPVVDTVANGNMNSVTSNAVNSFVENNYNKVNSYMSGGNEVYIEIGLTTNAQNNQSFSLIEIQAGRVDGFFNSGTITIAYDGTGSFIRGTRAAIMSDVEIYAIRKNNQTYLYAKLASYSALNVKVAKNSSFNATMQTVSSLTGDIIWNNEWVEVVTKNQVNLTTVVSASQNPDFITRYDISALLTGNCKLSIDIFTVIDGYKESVAKVMITRYFDYEVYLHIVYNSNEAYPITLENGILIAGNGNAYTYGGNAYVTKLN